MIPDQLLPDKSDSKSLGKEGVLNFQVTDLISLLRTPQGYKSSKHPNSTKDFSLLSQSKLTLISALDIKCKATKN